MSEFNYLVTRLINSQITEPTGLTASVSFSCPYKFPRKKYRSAKLTGPIFKPTQNPTAKIIQLSFRDQSALNSFSESAEDFILRWGTHYIKSGKFGGRLNIFKTMEANQVSSKAEFSQVMEAEFKSFFASLHAKDEQSGGSSQKQESKTSSTSISVEGGDQQIASLISDVNSPTIKNELKQWLESIRTFPKPFKFMVAPITDLLKFNPSSLFTDKERDWGCERHSSDMKKDPDTGRAIMKSKSMER